MIRRAVIHQAANLHRLNRRIRSVRTLFAAFVVQSNHFLDHHARLRRARNRRGI
jgi:hypothetical protein